MARWESWQIDYLNQNFRSMTDKEMGAFLERTPESIMQKRRKLGLKKDKASAEESIEATVAVHNEVRGTTALHDLTESQRRAELSNILLSSPIWAECKDMFDTNEMEYYKTRWIDFRMTYDSLNPVELDTLHVMLVALLRLNRYQKLEKSLRNEFTGPADEMKNSLVSVHREIKEMNEVYMKAMSTLSVSRDQRIKREGEQKVTLLTLLRELELKEGREKMARESDALKFIGTLERDRLTGDGHLRGEKSDA